MAIATLSAKTKNKMCRFTQILLLLVVALCCYGRVEGCTAAIVAAKASSEGGTILWKNRDSGNYRTSVRYFNSEKYAYTGVVTTERPDAGVFCGVNEVGFGIINTATKNLPKNKSLEGTGKRSPFMRDALINCATVDEFEEFVRNYQRGYKFMTNVGVGDAQGGAAFFEIWGDGYCRYDVNKSERGFDLRGNFSYAGDMSRIVRGKLRLDAILEQIGDKSKLSAKECHEFSRSYYVAGERYDLLNDEKLYVHESKTVTHRLSVGSFAIVCGKHPRILVAMGYPAACPAIPVWVEAKEEIPNCLSGTAAHLLGKKFAKQAYIKDGTFVSRGKKKGRYYLNKPLVRKALEVHTEFAFPEQMPKNIKRFNRQVDRRFNKHAHKIEALLGSADF